MKLPIHLCVDVEPNDREVAGDPAADWSATEPCINLLEEFRARAQASSGRAVHINWFLRLDPQVREAYGRADYAFERYRSSWGRAQAAGDGLGVHVHAWRMCDSQWVSDHGNADWVAHCVRESLDAFAQCTGHPATMFRFGDHFQSNEVVRQLEERGVRFEMTLEPGIPAAPVMRLGEPATGGLPDYTRVPRTPYFPSRHDYRKRAPWSPRRIRMIPASTGCAGSNVVPFWGGHFYHLNLAGDPALSRRICEGLLASRRTTHISWVARTGDFAFPQHQSNFRANLDYLAGRGLRFVRPDEVWG